MSKNNIIVIPGRSKTEYVTKEFHEHKAPTDESIKLLMEMEKAAQDKLLSITKLEGNELEAVWHVFEESTTHNLKVVCQFELNGKKHRIDLSLNYNSDHNEVAKTVYKAIGKKFAEILTIDFITKALFKRQG